MNLCYPLANVLLPTPPPDVGIHSTTTHQSWWTVIRSAQRRRNKTEENVKVVASVWGGEYFIQFLAALGILSGTIFDNRMNSSFSSIPSWCNSSYHSKSSQAKQLQLCDEEFNKFCPPPPKQKRRPLPFLLSLSFLYESA